jgi:hypothetical protein
MIRLALSRYHTQTLGRLGQIDKMSIGIYLFSFLFQINKFSFLPDRSNRWQTEGKIIKIKKSSLVRYVISEWKASRRRARARYSFTLDGRQ